MLSLEFFGRGFSWIRYQNQTNSYVQNWVNNVSEHFDKTDESEIMNNNEKFGYPKLIMDYLLSRSCNLSAIDSLESFINFSSTIRNVAAVVEERIEEIIYQRQLLANFVIQETMLAEKKLKDFSIGIQQMYDIVCRITFVSNIGNTKQSARKYLRISFKRCHREEM